MGKVLEFIRSRPTEVWLGGYTAIVGVLVASGVDLNAALVSAVGTLIAWGLTLIASHTDALGPLPEAQVPEPPKPQE